MKAYAHILLLVLGGITALLLMPGEAHAGEKFRFTSPTTIEAFDVSHPSPFSGATWKWDDKQNTNGFTHYYQQQKVSFKGCSQVQYIMGVHNVGENLRGHLTVMPGRVPASCDPYDGLTRDFDIDKNGQDVFGPNAPFANADTTEGDSCGGDGSFGTLLKNFVTFNSGKIIYENVICPIIHGLTEGITNLLKEVLTPLLKIEPLRTGTELHSAWNSFRTLANVGFVIAFLIIIFANVLSINLNAYTVKKMLPRLVAASVLVQISYLASALIVDIGNVLGDSVGAIIGTLGTDSGNTTNVLLGIGGGIGAGIGAAVAILNWPLILPIVIGMAIAALGFFLTLGIRFILITVMIMIAPLAFLAWLLPNTEQYFRKWLSTFFRLIMMYPIIIAILTAAGKVGELMPTGDTTGTAGGVVSEIMKVFVFIAALGMVPWTFKWAGGLMTTGAALMAGLTAKAAGGATNKLKDSQWYQDKQKDAQQRLTDRAKKNLDVKFGKPGAKGSKLGARAGLMLGGLAGGPTTELARQRSQSALNNAMYKEMEDLSETQDPNNLTNLLNAQIGDPKKRAGALRNLQQNAPALMRYMGSTAGRMAAVRMLADKGLAGESILGAPGGTSGFLNDPKLKGEYALALQAASQQAPKKPVLQLRYAADEIDDKGVRHAAGEIKFDVVRGVLSNKNATQIKNDVDADNYEIAQKDALAAKAVAQGIDSAAISQNFNSNTTNFMSAKKRVEFVKMMALQKDEFKDPIGSKVRDSVLDQIEQGNSDDILDQIVGPYGANLTTQQKRDFIRRFIES